jgi:signal transduction histidine kinase
VDELSSRLEISVETRSIVRIKVWDLTGAIVYSDVPALIGQRFGLPHEALNLTVGWAGTADISVQDALDNEFEAKSGELVEVYVRTETPEQVPLVVEMYYDDADVRRRQTSALLNIAPLFLGSLGVLALAQLLPAVGLARRIQHDAKRRVLQETIDASDRERRRIARELHDDVIQDLAGLSYAFEAERRHGTPEQASFFEKAYSIVQKNIGTLRAMTNELYPPDLEELGLPMALTRLAEELLTHGVEVRIDVPENITGLGREDSAMFYRVAREVFANIVKHAGASTAAIVLTQDETGTVMLIHDDGQGFNQDEKAPAGHLGLRIVQDSVSAAGGTLEVNSEPGGGTWVVTRLDRSGGRGNA